MPQVKSNQITSNKRKLPVVLAKILKKIVIE